MKSFARRGEGSGTRATFARIGPPTPVLGGAAHSFANVPVLQRQGHRARRPPPNPYPTRARCIEPELSTVIAAFNQGLREVAQARGRVIDYLTYAGDRRNCNRVRRALQRHFGWTEAVRTQLTYPDVPCHILAVFDAVLASPPTVEAWCQTVPPPTDRGTETLANAGGPPNMFTFYGPFFRAGAGTQAMTAIHELMHKQGMSDVAYRFEPNYGDSPRSMFDNPDSHAGLAHDLGSDYAYRGTNPCVNNVLPAGTRTACT